jgi:hypothetical protein
MIFMTGKISQIAVCNSATVQAKTGHAILKSIYTTVAGDRVFSIIDDTTGTTAKFSFKADAGNSAPHLNTPFTTGVRIVVASGTSGEIVVMYE